MSFDWRQLTFSELIVVVFVAIELVVVAVALVAMIWVRSTTMQRQSAYNAVKNRLIDLISQMQADNEAATMRQCLAALGTLARDQQRRLLTELAEYAGSGGVETDPVFAELFTAAGLVVDARQNAIAQPWERLRVIREARALADPAGLLDKMIRDAVPDVRIGAFEALCTLGRADEALTALPALAGDGRLNRLRAIDSLAIARPFPTDETIALAESPVAEVRQVCIASLGQARQRQALQAVIHAVTDVDVEVRIHALRALAELREASSLGVVLSALQDDRWEVRSDAAKTVGALAAPGAAAPLAQLLDDEAEWVRHNAALALVKCGPAGIAALRQAAAMGNASAQSALAEARMTPVEEAAAAPLRRFAG